MNKYIFIALAAAGMSLASCDEYTLPNPPAQSNPQEPVFKNTDLTVTNAVSGTIDLPALNTEHEPVWVLNYSFVDFPESYTLQFVAQFSADETFAETYDVNAATTPADNVGHYGFVTLAVADVQTAVNTLISKSPAAQNIYVRYPVYAVNGTSHVRIGGPDVYYYQGVYNVLPMRQENVIEKEYFLIGNFCDWDFSKAIPFTQLHEGNPYDNPEFTVKIDVDKALADSPEGFQWKVLPVSSFLNLWLDGAFGAVANGDEPNGNLIPVNGKETPGVIRQEGPYMININMETRRYTVDPAFEYLWVPGMGSSTTDFNRIMRLSTSDYIHYSGTMRLASRFWFTGQASLNGVSFRPDGDATTNDAGVTSGKMIYDVTSTTMMRVPSTGLYYVQANVVSLDWSITPIPVISLIGAYNSWDTATAIDLTPNSRKDVWTITGVDMPEGEYKFCVNHDWALSYGGEPGNIVQNGGNLNITEAGVYDITLNFSVFPNTCTATKR